MPQGANILHNAVLQAHELTADSSTFTRMVSEYVAQAEQAHQVLRVAMVEYADAVRFCKTPVQWNVKQVNGYACLDHPEVRGTNYMEVHHLIGTSGCSNDATMWQWSVMGVIVTRQGKLLVNPGDWVVEVTKGHFLVLDDTTYRNLYL